MLQGTLKRLLLGLKKRKGKVGLVNCQTSVSLNVAVICLYLGSYWNREEYEGALVLLHEELCPVGKTAPKKYFEHCQALSGKWQNDFFFTVYECFSLQGDHSECHKESSCKRAGYSPGKIRLTTPAAVEAYTNALKDTLIYKYAESYSRVGVSLFSVECSLTI